MQGGKKKKHGEDVADGSTSENGKLLAASEEADLQQAMCDL